MFSHDSRCILHRNQLAEVICQFRFPEILIIGTTAPAEFQEKIRGCFPKYSVRKESNGPQIRNISGSFQIENSPVTTNYQFTTADNIWKVNLTSGFISLSCRRYTRWEEFARYFDHILAAFITTYSPAYFTRIGLRYLNFISRQDLDLHDMQFKDLIEPCYLGPLADDEIPENAATQCTVDTQIQLRNCTLKLHAGPGMVKRNGVDDGEAKFIFDQDLYMNGNIPITNSASVLNTLHNQAYSVFRGAITDRLFEAMEPETI